MPDKNDPKNEGHTREWQDRARVVLDAKRDAGTEADPNQSPENDKEQRKEKDDVKEEKSSHEQAEQTNNSFY